LGISEAYPRDRDGEDASYASADGGLSECCPQAESITTLTSRERSLLLDMSQCHVWWGVAGQMDGASEGAAGFL
jgi:hypothetical protein